MLSNTLITHTNTQAVRDRPTLKDVERFRNGSVRELKEKQRKLIGHSETSNRRNKQSECEESMRRMDKRLSTGACTKFHSERIFTAANQCENSYVYLETKREKKVPILMLCLCKGTDGPEGQTKSNYASYEPVLVNIMIVLIVLILFRKVTLELLVCILRVVVFHVIVYFATFQLCEVRDCASSAKSVRSDVLHKAIQATVDKENGVQVEINGLELRSRQAKFIYIKNNNRIGVLQACLWSTRSCA